MGELHVCGQEMIWMYFAGLASGLILSFFTMTLLWKFQTKRMKRIADFLHLRDRHGGKPSDTEKRRTYSLRAPPAPPDSPVVLRRKQTTEPAMTYNNHVTLQSMYSSPYDAKFHKSTNHVMLQSMYSDPRDFVLRVTRSSSKLQEDDDYSEVVKSVQSRGQSRELGVTLPSSMEEPLYSTVRHSQHRNCKKMSNPDRWTNVAQPTPNSNRCSKESSPISGNREVLGEHRLSAFQSYRRSTCPELDLHRLQRCSRSKSQDERLSQRPRTEITNADNEIEYKHKSDGYDEPLYYTLDNVNPCPIRPLSGHVMSRDSQYSTQSSVFRDSFPGRMSVSLSETIMSEYPFLRQESGNIARDPPREATSSSAISTSV